MNATGRTTKIESHFASLARAPKGSPVYRRLLEKIRRNLTDPRLPADFLTFSDSSPFIDEAYAVSDAFESVTNGMYNPEALTRIAAIDSDSPVYYWQRLVYAVLAYYQGDRDNMRQFLEQIPEGYPPDRLKPVLLHLAGEGGAGAPSAERLSRAQKRLIDAVREDRTYVHSAVGQLAEYLESGMEETFAETAVLLIRDLAFSHTRAAKRLAITCMRLGGEDSHALFTEQLRLIFGETEGNRLVALALIEEAPDVSILFWIRLILHRLRVEDMSMETTEAHLSVVGDLALELIGEFQSGEVSPQYFERLSSLTRKLDDELSRRFRFPVRPSAHGETDPFRDPLGHLASLAGVTGATGVTGTAGRPGAAVETGATGAAGRDPSAGAAGETGAADRPRQQKEEFSREPVQLELFR